MPHHVTALMNLPETHHPQHCRRCKERIREMLIALYGACQVNYGFPWPARPEHYAPTVIGEPLQRIRAALSALRGHRDFIKSALVPPCDYYMPQSKLIVELDESQHFSYPRMISLALYPDHQRYGFSLARWQDLCGTINALDDTPIDRDERRAWYDVLRDLVPAVYGFKPTARLYAGDYDWCSLDAANAEDRNKFGAFLVNDG